MQECNAKLETLLLFVKQTSNAVKRIAAIFQCVNRLVVGVKKRIVKKKCKRNNAINVTRTRPQYERFCSKPNSRPIDSQELQMNLLIVWGACLGKEPTIRRN